MNHLLRGFLYGLGRMAARPAWLFLIAAARRQWVRDAALIAFLCLAYYVVSV